MTIFQIITVAFGAIMAVLALVSTISLIVYMVLAYRFDDRYQKKNECEMKHETTEVTHGSIITRISGIEQMVQQIYTHILGGK